MAQGRVPNFDCYSFGSRVHNLYRYSVPPDVVFYLHISPEEAVKRRLSLQQQRLDMVQKHGEPDITPRQIEMTVQHFNKGERGEYRIFCAHHSFLPVPTKGLRPGDVVPRSADILQTLIELNVDLLCCGHIHRSHVWDLSDGRHRLLCCNAGSFIHYR